MIDAATGPELATNQDLDVARQVPAPDAAERAGLCAIGAGPTGVVPTSSIVRIAPGDRLALARPFTAAFVVDADRRPAGILHIHDLPRAGLV